MDMGGGRVILGDHGHGGGLSLTRDHRGRSSGHKRGSFSVTMHDHGHHLGWQSGVHGHRGASTGMDMAMVGDIWGDHGQATLF